MYRVLVTIEGGDQAGKKTQCALLEEFLLERGLKVAIFDFPDYSTPIGRVIRSCLDGTQPSNPQTIHCLLSANRWEKLDEIVEAQSDNDIIIMNRYHYSNLVYGVVNGLETSWLKNLDSGLPCADLVILLDITQAESFKRKRRGRDRFERDEDFSRRVFSGYRSIAEKEGWKIVDGSKSKEEIRKEIADLVIRESESRVRINGTAIE